MSVPKILVTGAAGYIGSTLVDNLLEAGYKVVGLDNLLYDNGPALFGHLGHPRFEFAEGTALDSALVSRLLRDCDGVIPLAALVGAPLCQRQPLAARLVNYQAVKSLVGKMSRGQRIVYPNTNSGYGSTDGVSPCTEDDPLTPISVYGKTKCDAEKAVLDHPNSATLRLATVFGASPRMRLDLLVNDFAHQLSIYKRSQARHVWPPAAPPLTLFEPHYKRNFVGVKDVARAFCFALARPWLKGPFNVGLPSANLTKLELANKVCDALGVDRSVISIGTGKDPDQRNYLVSNDKILGAGFHFGHSLEQGIREVAAVCQLTSPEQREQMRNV